MRRNHFLIIAAIVPAVFGFVMMVAPNVMLEYSLVSSVDAETRAATQWAGFGVFSLASINFLSRNDPGSTALRAVMIGNFLFHAIGLGFNIYHYSAGILTAADFASGVASHAILGVGFLYYLSKLDTHR